MDQDNQCILHGDRLTRVEVILQSIKDDYLVPIREQTERTNGRVTALESRATRNSAWIGFLWIALGAVSTALFSLTLGHVFSK